MVYAIMGELLLNMKNHSGRNEYEVSCDQGINIVKVVSGEQLCIKKLFFK